MVYVKLVDPEIDTRTHICSYIYIYIRSYLCVFRCRFYRVCKVIGSGVTETKAISGIVIKRPAEGNITSVEKAKVAVFACPLDIGRTETKGIIVLSVCLGRFEMVRRPKRSYFYISSRKLGHSRHFLGTVLIKNAEDLLNFNNEEESRLEEVMCNY